MTQSRFKAEGFGKRFNTGLQETLSALRYFWCRSEIHLSTLTWNSHKGKPPYILLTLSKQDDQPWDTRVREIIESQL